PRPPFATKSEHFITQWRSAISGSPRTRQSRRPSRPHDRMLRRRGGAGASCPNGCTASRNGPFFGSQYALVPGCGGRPGPEGLWARASRGWVGGVVGKIPGSRVLGARGAVPTRRVGVAGPQGASSPPAAPLIGGRAGPATPGYPAGNRQNAALRINSADDAIG